MTESHIVIMMLKQGVRSGPLTWHFKQYSTKLYNCWSHQSYVKGGGWHAV